MNNNICVVIPTLNPNTKILEKFLDKLKKEFKYILVYDDGSNEEYKAFFDELEKEKIIVLHHYVNMGKGRALKDAFNYLLVEYPHIKGVVTADSDGQHTVKDIKTCSELVLGNEEALVLGARDFESPNVPKKNGTGNKITRNVMKILLGLKIKDTQTGLRGLSKNVMQKFLTTSGERYEYETNMLVDTISKEIRIMEFPIETIYDDDSKKESHFNPIKDSFAIYKIFIKYILSSVTSFLVDILLFALFNNYISIMLSTIISRIISSFVNFSLNKNVVFKKGNKTSLIKYAILVIIQMLVSGSVVTYFTNLTHISSVIVKIVVDILIFIVNYYIQRNYVFVGGKNE